MPKSIIVSGGKITEINARTAARKFKKRKRIWLMIHILLILCVVFALLKYSESRARPIIARMAEAHMRSIGTRIANEAAGEEIARSALTYDDLVSFVKTEDGRINALKINILNVNSLKSTLSAVITDKLLNMDDISLNIPAASLFRDGFLSGRGPAINVILIPQGSVSADIRSIFTSAGINQTHHQIILDIRISVSVIMPFAMETVYIHTSAPIAETIIVGEAPVFYGSKY